MPVADLIPTHNYARSVIHRCGKQQIVDYITDRRASTVCATADLANAQTWFAEAVPISMRPTGPFATTNGQRRSNQDNGKGPIDPRTIITDAQVIRAAKSTLCDYIMWRNNAYGSVNAIADAERATSENSDHTQVADQIEKATMQADLVRKTTEISNLQRLKTCSDYAKNTVVKHKSGSRYAEAMIDYYHTNQGLVNGHDRHSMDHANAYARENGFIAWSAVHSAYKEICKMTTRAADNWILFTFAHKRYTPSCVDSNGLGGSAHGMSPMWDVQYSLNAIHDTMTAWHFRTRKEGCALSDDPVEVNKNMVSQTMVDIFVGEMTAGWVYPSDLRPEAERTPYSTKYHTVPAFDTSYDRQSKMKSIATLKKACMILGGPANLLMALIYGDTRHHPHELRTLTRHMVDGRANAARLVMEQKMRAELPQDFMRYTEDVRSDIIRGACERGGHGSCCPICIQPLGAEECATIMPACLHLIHKRCVCDLMQHKQECPTCKTKFSGQFMDKAATWAEIPHPHFDDEGVYVTYAEAAAAQVMATANATRAAMRLDIESGDYARRVCATKIQREFKKHYTPPQGPHDPDEEYVPAVVLVDEPLAFALAPG